MLCDLVLPGEYFSLPVVHFLLSNAYFSLLDGDFSLGNVNFSFCDVQFLFDVTMYYMCMIFVVKPHITLYIYIYI